VQILLQIVLISVLVFGLVQWLLSEKLLKNLDPTKATGPDQIPARILKQFAAEFAPHLTTIFNTSITKGEVPSFLHENHVDSRLRCYADLDVLRCYSLRCVLKVYSIYR
jgi:hypothetical protein